MTAAEIRRIYRARPFRRFRLQLADGRSVPVLHPELMILAPAERTVYVYVPGDGLEIVDIPLVTAISFRGRKQPSE